MKPLLRLLIPSALLAAILVLFLQGEPFSRADPATDSFLFEVKMDAPGAGDARLFYDRGGGLRVFDSSSAKLQPGAQTCRFLVPPGEYASLRLALSDPSAPILIHEARIVALQGREIRRFSAAEWSAGNADDRLAAKAGTLAVAHGASLVFDRTLVLQPPISATAAALQFLFITALVALLLHQLGPRLVPAFSTVAARTARWPAIARAHPHWTLFITAALAVLVSCHPIVFAGRSFVAPNNRALCLYDEFPTVPGSTDANVEDPKGSDIGATMWAHLPYSVLQHRAIFEDHEIPLWNRYSSAGVTLLGQGQSMLGDPLHWIAILGGGASWPWDVKFLLAKLLFTFGVGLLVRAATARLGVSVLLGASSAFIGFFAYRFNHAAFFSLCYAPWILLAWLGIMRSRAASLRWPLLLVAANWIEFQSGTAKESAMLIAGLNFTGGLAVLLAAEPFAARVRKLALGAGALVVFLLLAAPFWMVFLDALGRAHTVYDRVRAFQIQPAQFIGLFDDLFYRQTMPHELHTNPSANFLVLLGVLWAAVNARRLWSCPPFAALVLGSLPPLALAFGIVPPGLIERLPFLGNISHVDNTFSCVLIVLLFPIAGLGLQACRDRFAEPEWRTEWVLTLVFAAGLTALYLGGTQVVGRADAAVTDAHAALPRSAFFLLYAPAILLSIALLPPAARRLLHLRRDLLAAALVGAISLGAIHFRHGMYLETKFNAYVMNPQPRLELAALSPAVEYVATHCDTPARVAGLGSVLVSGFNIVRGLEHFSGPDAVQNAQYAELLAAARLPCVWGWRHLALKESYGALGKFYDLLGVRWFLGATRDPVKAVPGLTLVGTRDLDVFESRTAWPRAFFTDRLATYESADDFAALVAASDGRPFAAIQRTGPGIARDWSLGDDQSTRQLVPAQSYRLRSNDTAFQIETPAPGLVVLGEAWTDGDLRVTIDGQPAPCVRVNHAFRGVWVGKSGPHWIEFTYLPRRLAAGLWCAGIGLIFLCGAVGFGLRRALME